MYQKKGGARMILDKLKPNPNNPRIITKKDFDILMESLEQLPEMLDLRPMAYDSSKDYIVLGGNSRLRGVQELRKRGKEIKDSWFVDIAGWSEEKKKQFIIRDNINNGTWNWDMLANEWDTDLLEDWGVPISSLNDLNDAEKEWDGMPEFGNTDKSGYKHILISFENEEDVQAFAKLIGQEITEKTRYLWYPEHERQTMIDKEYITE